MINRKINNKLRRFFTENDKALLVTGARQIGKTFSIRNIGKDCFENFVEINFLEQKDAVRLFKESQGAEDLLLRLSSFVGKKLIPGKTLIFFDEVQECREIVTAIKFLVEEGNYRYVMSGSLLGVELRDIKSVPVGYMSIMDMYPLDFEEFVCAVGIGSNIIDYLHRCYDEKSKVDSLIHEKMMQLLKLYLLVGGMPMAVQKYLDTNNLRTVYNVQRDIVRLYKRDIAKYDTESKLRIDEVYNLIPSELNSQNKRFILKNLNENARFRQYEADFLWLKEAGVAIPTYNVEEPKIPLLLNKQHNLMKLFLNDIGLLSCMIGGDIQIKIMQGITNINFGSMFENLTAQELYAHGWAGDEKNLFYFSSKKQGELDFLIEDNGKVIPIEVKSGKDYHRHNALDSAIRNSDYGMDKAFVFCQDNVRTEGIITYLPIYMLMFLQKSTSLDVVWKLDLSDINNTDL